MVHKVYITQSLQLTHRVGQSPRTKIQSSVEPTFWTLAPAVKKFWGNFWSWWTSGERHCKRKNLSYQECFSFVIFWRFSLKVNVLFCLFFRGILVRVVLVFPIFDFILNTNDKLVVSIHYVLVEGFQHSRNSNLLSETLIFLQFASVSVKNRKDNFNTVNDVYRLVTQWMMFPTRWTVCLIFCRKEDLSFVIVVVICSCAQLR